MVDPANQGRTRTEATKKANHRRGGLLLAVATRETGIDPLDPVGFVQWFLGQANRWSRSTIRQYRTSIREFLTTAMVLKPSRSVQVTPALDLLAEVVDPDTGRLAAPGAVKRPWLTSAGKRKRLAPNELKAVDAALISSRHKFASLARIYLALTCTLGLRPSEWPTAQIIGTVLIVQNGKNSNGRANGPTRTIELQAYSKAFIHGLGKFIEALAEAAAAQGWSVVHAGIRRALRVASVATGIPSLIKKPVTPYTCRHIAAARMKATKEPAEVAALLGHATDETASVHYAPRSAAKGWKPVRIEAPEGAEDVIRLRHVAFPDRQSVVRRAKMAPPASNPTP